MATINFKKNKKKVIIILLLTFGTVALCILGYIGYLYYQAYNIVTESHEEIDRENNRSTLREQQIDPVKDNVSVLFIGIDDSEHRDSTYSRSDALILSTFNKNENSIKLLSIPRDTYVYVPEVNRFTKINHAHAYGGVEAAIDTVEEYLKIPVDYYVRLNFNAFVEVIDALGGIWFNVPFEMIEPDSGDNRDAIHLKPGYQLLDGEEALALTRSRKYDSDIERGKRQQEVIRTIAETIASASSLLKFEEVLNAIGANMTSNLKMTEIRGFFSYGLTSDLKLQNVNFQGAGGYMSDGGWYYIVDEDSKLDIQNELRNHLEMYSYENEQEW